MKKDKMDKEDKVPKVAKFFVVSLYALGCATLILAISTYLEYIQ